MNCTICPRRCGADRANKPGLCGVGENLRVARAALHHWEEPCISGTGGSGTVFFSGCPLKCCFCQNHDISASAWGKDISTERLSEIFLELQAQGAHNINLVNPTHFAQPIAVSLKLAKVNGLVLPVVWNSGGYDSAEGLALMEGLVDIYMPDIKYMDSDRSLRYSGAGDYFAVASKAVIKMYRQAGPAVFGSDGIMKKGLIIRHLVLPGGTADSIAILGWIAANLGVSDIVLSLMSQYIPCHESNKYPEINRRLTSLEYNRVLDQFHKLGFAHGYCQQRSSAKEEYVPAFNLDGV
jgi:putative pyruvate formate lyase activating enzyme